MMSKAPNDNGSRQIMYLREGMGSGLKILVSAVQSPPCPLSGIYSWFTEGFDTADLSEAKSLLEELRARAGG